MLGLLNGFDDRFDNGLLDGYDKGLLDGLDEGLLERFPLGFDFLKLLISIC